MSKSQRTKGANFEREVVRQFRELGHHVARNLDQWRDGGGDIALKRWMFECKRRAKISVYEWMEQCKAAARGEQVPVVIARGDNKEALVIMRFEDFLEMFDALERSMVAAEAIQSILEDNETKTIN